MTVPIPTVASLCASLGQHLTPFRGVEPTVTQVTAVHISELLDPSPYLAGGELLLTLGISLPTSKIGSQKYVASLRRSKVSAVALGLGPVWESVPPSLADACREQQVPLLVVPARTPFLTVTKAYWSALASSNERHLNDAIATHRALVDAAASPDPVASMLTRLARWLEGWAATLDASGALDQIHPAGSQDDAEALSSEVARLEVAGVHSAASFAVDGRVVVVFPLAVDSRIVGYLAVGTEHQLDASQRAVVLGACGLISLEFSRDQKGASEASAYRHAVALLIDDGYVAAADRLAGRLGLPPVPQACRVITLRGRDADALRVPVESWAGGCLSLPVDRSTLSFVVPAGATSLADLSRLVRAADDATRGEVSHLVKPEDIGGIRARQLSRIGRLAPGEIVVPPDNALIPDLDARLDAVLESGPAAVEALVAYLRSHGQWEQAARDLGVHRNTLRYRVERARSVLGLELDDADVTARLWLLLRERGIA